MDYLKCVAKKRCKTGVGIKREAIHLKKLLQWTTFSLFDFYKFVAFSLIEVLRCCLSIIVDFEDIHL